MTEAGSPIPEAPPAPGLVAGLAVTVVVVVAIVGWIVLGGSFLAETSLVGGFLMLWYWAKVENLSVARLPASIIGALVGIGLGWGLIYGASNYGPAGLAIALLVLIGAIYLDIVQIAPLFVNAATMLYSTIAAAPLVQLKVNWIELCLSTAGGGVFFAVFVAAASWLAGRFANKR